MTVSSQVRKAGPYSGTGSTGPFSFSFKVFAASDLLVVKANSSGTETTLALTTDYTVSLNADQNANPGGTITLVAALAVGYTMVIGSQVPYLQETDLTNQGGFYPEVITDALDKLTIETQQLKEEVDRSAKLPITNTTDADALVADIIRLADSADNVDTVAGSIANVNSVAGNSSNINTVAGSISNVNTTASNIANVNAVAGNATNINAVAGNATNINAVNANATNINAVNANKTNIDAVAGNSTNINAVNANKANIDINAANIVDIQNAEENAQIVLSALNEVTDGVRDRFVAGVNYTKNTTTQLTLSNTPLKGETVKVFFSGVYQEKTTWSRSGAVITFTSAIPVDSVEVTYDIGRSFAELDTAVATATTKASEASASAATANTKAGEAAGSAASALAIYGSAAAQQTAVSTAQAQASLAAGYAASASSVVQQDLSAITAQALHRSPNAVTAMFIYDTSKDSDGGAWTEKCQHTSWYNEPLMGKWLGAQASETAARAVSGATTGDYFQLTTDGKFYSLNATSGKTEVFRGNKAKFPKLAGIVAEAANVTIYDLTEPGRPMWMRFITSNTGGIYGGYGSGISSVSIYAINGILSNAHGSVYMGITVVDFVKDTARRHREGSTANGSSGYWKGNLSNRNNAAITFDGSTPGTIANGIANAVAMTVLPDAPVDPVTGLQVPTIAVATAGGVSVIKHNGTVVSDTSGSNYSKVYIDKDVLMATISFGIGLTRFAYNPGSITSFNLSDQDSLSWYTQAGRDNGVFNNIAGAQVSKKKLNKSTRSKSVNALITNLYATGTLIGNTKRCYLADNTTGTISSSELVTNGTFNTDTSGWSGTAALSVVSGSLQVLSSGGNYQYGYTSVPLVVGKSYRILVTLTGTNATYRVRIGSSITGSDYANLIDSSGATSGTIVSASFTATTTTGYITVMADVSGSYCMVDNVSVQEAVPDRINSKYAAITGSITKALSSPSASNQITAYSGFSAANYLQEPYSADLDFGTGEWSAGAWVNVPTTLPVVSFPAVSSELVTNGTFDTDTAWTKATGVTIAGGVCTFTNVASSNGIQQNGVINSNNTDYALSFTVNSISGGLTVTRSNGTGVASTITAPGSYSFLFNSGTTNGYTDVKFVNGQGAALTCEIDNVSVKKIGASALADRAYSSGASIKIGLSPLGNLTATAYDGTTTRTVTTSAAYNTATWLKAEAVYKTDGSLAILVNGQEVAVTRGNPLLTLNNSNAVLTIGNSYALDAPFPGSIALLKLSATAPTYDQAQWMYEQEKQLFRDGAQCCLPDSGNIVDLTYDDVTDKWVAVSATNESSWTGLVRTNVTAVPAGSNSKVVATSGVKLNARTTTSPGVDVTIPAYGLREELLKDGEDSGKLARIQVPLDYVGGFTATTVNGNTAITSVAGLSYPSQTTIIGATVTGSGIPASTTVVGISGTTIYLSKAATASASGVQISFTDFVLPLGMEAKEVIAGGAIKVGGSTKDFTRLYDGFRETIRFGTAPGYTAAVQIIAIRSQA